MSIENFKIKGPLRTTFFQVSSPNSNGDAFKRMPTFTDLEIDPYKNWRLFEIKIDPYFQLPQHKLSLIRFLWGFDIFIGTHNHQIPVIKTTILLSAIISGVISYVF